MPGAVMDYPLPCSYRDYCSEYEDGRETGSYRLADDPAKLLKRFEAGPPVEYSGEMAICWVQEQF